MLQYMLYNNLVYAPDLFRFVRIWGPLVVKYYCILLWYTTYAMYFRYSIDHTTVQYCCIPYTALY